MLWVHGCTGTVNAQGFQFLLLGSPFRGGRVAGLTQRERKTPRFLRRLEPLGQDCWAGGVINIKRGFAATTPSGWLSDLTSYYAVSDSERDPLAGA